MSKIVAVEYLSLDGVMEEPGWSGPYFNDEVQQFQYNNLFSSDALLLGRATYEGFKSAWPSMSDEQGFADRMNSMPKYVATTTLAEGEWNATPQGQRAGRGGEAEERTRRDPPAQRQRPTVPDAARGGPH
jgi:dihydrofolate reductase